MMFLKLMRDGGPVMWLILAGGVLGFFFFLKKTFQFHREEINVRELLRGLTNALDRNGIVEALTLCDNTPGPVARMLGAAILAYERGDENIRQAIDDAALDELPKLEQHLNFIGTLAFILPLIGFLGTVLGMLETFEVFKESAYLSSSTISGSVMASLLTTAAGLTVAIPCHLAYNYLTERANSIALDMEKAALEITGFLERKQHKATEK